MDPDLPIRVGGRLRRRQGEPARPTRGHDPGLDLAENGHDQAVFGKRPVGHLNGDSSGRAAHAAEQGVRGVFAEAVGIGRVPQFHGVEEFKVARRRMERGAEGHRWRTRHRPG